MHNTIHVRVQCNDACYIHVLHHGLCVPQNNYVNKRTCTCCMHYGEPIIIFYDYDSLKVYAVNVVLMLLRFQNCVFLVFDYNFKIP